MEAGDGRGRKKLSTSSSLAADRELVEGEEEMEGEEEGERGGRGEEEEEEEEEEGGRGEGGARDWAEDHKDWKEKHYKFGKRSPPPLIRRPLSPISRFVSDIEVQKSICRTHLLRIA